MATEGAWTASPIAHESCASVSHASFSSVSVPAVVDMQTPPKSSGKESKTALLINAESSAPVALSSPAPASIAASSKSVQEPQQRWRAQRKWVAVMLGDASVLLLLSLVSFSLWNIVSSGCGVVAGVLWFTNYFLYIRTQAAIKAFYWPGLVSGCLASVSCVKDIVVAIMKLVDSPLGGTVALPFRIVFIGLNGVLGATALWVWIVGRQVDRALEEQAALAANSGLTGAWNRTVGYFRSFTSSRGQQAAAREPEPEPSPV